MKSSLQFFTSILLFAVALPSGAVTAAPDMPKGLWQAFTEVRYLVEESNTPEDGYTFHAHNPNNRYDISYGDHGLKLETADWEFAMTLTSYGQAQSLKPVANARIVKEGNKVTFDRGNVNEWYINETQGLEQGFTLKQPESYNPDEHLLLSLDISGGLNPEWKDKGQSIAFYTGNNHAFDYSKLKAFDAEGEELPAQLALLEDQLLISVDARSAQWPVTVDPIFSTVTKLVGTAEDVEAGSLFGGVMALDGNTALVSAVWEDEERINQGAVYVFVRSSTSEWTYQDKLTVGQQSYLGESLAISGDTVAIGMPTYEEIGMGTLGTVYLFERSGETWSQVRQVSSPNPADGGQFGIAVGLYGNDLVIGARHETSFGVSDRGNTYVYVKPLAGWSALGSPTVTLYAADGTTGDEFGSSVSINNGLVLVGAPGKASGRGAAYVFRKDPSFGWFTNPLQDRAKLSSVSSSASDGFGASVAIFDSTDTALIGSSEAEEAYVFYDGDGFWSDSVTPTATLTASDNVINDGFGASVALYGNNALVGAKYAGAATGAAYLFIKPPTGGWVNAHETAKLTASDASVSDYFGLSVAIGQDDILVGAPYDDHISVSQSFNSGAVYLYREPESGWVSSTEDRKLTASTFGEIRGFGYSVSIDNHRALIGALSDSTENAIQGSAYIFDRENDIWTLTARLVPSDGGAGDTFGRSVSLSGDKALIGSTGQSAAYVFTYSGGEWMQTAKLQTTDPLMFGAFGKSVALLGDIAAVGAESANPGMVYIYTYSGSAWTERAKLIALGSDILDDFGSSISLSEDTVLVGAPNYSRDGVLTGAAYVFVKPGTNWNGTTTETAKLLYADAQSPDGLGASVSLYGDTALVGADGAAYVFDKPIGGWSDMTAETAKLLPSDGTVSLPIVGSIYGSTVVLGDPNNSATNAGAAFVFARSGSQWYEVSKLTAPEVINSEYFGDAVALTGDTALIGATHINTMGADGSAYIHKFDCGFAGPVIANRWTQVGIPCDVGSADTVEDVFGDNLDPGEYRQTWILYRYDQSTQRYLRMGLDSSLAHGEGYWLFSSTAGVWDAEGERTTYTESIACESVEGCFEIVLVEPAPGSTESRFNLVAHPGNTTVDWASVKVMVDGIDYFPSEAADAGFITDTIWKYSGSGYDTYDSDTPGMNGTLESHEGFWVEVPVTAIGHDVKLLVPAGGALGGPPGLPDTPFSGSTTNYPRERGWIETIIDFFIPSAHAAKPTWEQEWYLRLIAEARAENLKDRGNVLGQLQDSVAGYDSHDLIELDPFSTPYLTLVFPHDDWGTESGNYASDYHEAVDYYAEDQWVFQVKSDNPYRDINLYWDGIYLLEGIWSQDTGKRTFSKSKQADGGALLQRMWLEDMDTGERVEAIIEDPITGAFSKQSHQFNMNGLTVRTFRWVLDSDGGKSPKKPKKPKSNSSGKVKVKNTPPGLDRIDMQPPEAGQN